MATPGEPKDQRYGGWLAPLGAATDVAASLTMTCFHLARVLGGVPSAEMHREPLVALERRVRAIGMVTGAGAPRE